MPLRFFNTTRAHNNGHGERSEPSLNRSDDFPAPANAHFFCEVPRFARDDTAMK
jgi:hypothetical protein